MSPISTNVFAQDRDILTHLYGDMIVVFIFIYEDGHQV